MTEPRANPQLEGHQAARAGLAAAARGGRLHHAWLLAGPRGVGKATLGYRFARWLLAGMPGGEGLDLPASHPVFRRIAAGSHADVLTINAETLPEKRKRLDRVIADAARLIPPFLSLTPAEDGWRVVVLEDADTMEPAAANAVLKVIEEPPRRALILLLADAPGRLLPTLRSRCRRLDLAPLDAAAMDRVLADRLPELDQPGRARLVALAGGSPGRALDLAEGDGAALHALADRALAGIGGPPARALPIADAALKLEDGLAGFLAALTQSLAASLRTAARGRPDPLAQRLLAQRPLGAWAEVLAAIERLARSADRLNLDPRATIVVTVAGLDGTIPPERIAS